MQQIVKEIAAMITKQSVYQTHPKQIVSRPLFLLLIIILFLATSCTASDSDTSSKTGSQQPSGTTPTAQSTSQTTVPGTVLLELAPVANTPIPSPEQMEQARQIINQRARNMGLQEASSRVVTTNGLSIQIALLPFNGDKEETIKTLLTQGHLEFWDTGLNGIMQEGTTFDPFLYASYNSKGPDGDMQAQFSGQDLDPASLKAIQADNGGGTYWISFAMKAGDPMTRFAMYTQNNIGHALTITLDRTVITSATIAGQITDQGRITGNFTQQKAQQLVALLKSNPIPVALHLISESTIEGS
jgi:preprotein translocase subunit SecD